MDIPALEEIIQFSIVENDKKLQATQYLDQVRASPDRWNVGMKLFFDGKTEVAQFFGLSLVRDYMSNLHSLPATESIREYVRDSMKGWLFKLLSQNISVPNYIINNVASILTLSIKNDYPELWPTAFSELLQLGSTHGLPGVDVVLRVLGDLEHEVVMFNEGRTRAEIAHNVLIKDSMRQSDTIRDIVRCLCSWAPAALSANNKELSERTLLSLAEMIGWIDVYLVLGEALPTVYSLFQDRRVRCAATACLLELVKKGMDPLAKVQMIQTIGLLPLLASVPVSSSASTSGKDNNEGSVEELRQLGLVVDMVVLELAGCWAKFEDSVVYVSRPGGPGAAPSPKVTSRKGAPATVAMSRDSSTKSNAMGSTDGGGDGGAESALEAASTVSTLLRAAVAILLPLFNHPDVTVCSAVFPSCNRLISMLKAQSTGKARIEYVLQNPATVTVVTPAGKTLLVSQFVVAETYFLASQYLDALLMGIYAQLQSPIDFDFSGCMEDGGISFSSASLSDEDDNDIVEAKKEVRKLFVNCCRVHPERCLELVGAVLTALPQPISTAPFPPLEAALRLVHAFSECGPANSKLVSEGTFPLLVQAIHATDIASHAHPQVLLSYFEIALRYIKLVDGATVTQIMGSLMSTHGLRSTDSLIRNRSAYFVVKIAEAMEGRSSALLSAIANPLSEIIFNSNRIALEALSSSSSSSPRGNNIRLSESAEQYLFETLGLMTSSVHIPPGETEALLRQYQQSLLSDVATHMVRQITELINNRAQLSRNAEQYTQLIAHKLYCLSCLAKGHNCKTHAHNIQYFDSITATVVSVLEAMPAVQIVRAKAVVYLHRMVSALGARCVLYVTQAMAVLVAQAETPADLEDVVTLLDQCMAEFQLHALNLAARYHSQLMERFAALTAAFESSIAGAIASSAGGVEAPHVEAERVSLQKQQLLYLQHVVTHSCHSLLLAPEHVHGLQDLFSMLLACVKGGRGGTLPSNSTVSQQAGLPLRKGAIIVLTGLVKVWCPPSPTVSAEAAAAAGFVSNAATALSPALLAAFQSFLYEHAVPAMLSSCSDGGRSVNVKDAASQSVLVEVAALLWTLHFVLGQQDTVAYFSGVMTTLSWNVNIQQTFLQQLTASQPLGAYKESFKQFIRSCS